jgi:hypothetical protein
VGEDSFLLQKLKATTLFFTLIEGIFQTSQLSRGFPLHKRRKERLKVFNRQPSIQNSIVIIENSLT